MKQGDIDYKILKILKGSPNITQRQLSQELGLSLGKTNYIINALIDRGWVKLTNFKRSDNKIGYIYMLTPKGLKNKTKLAQKFLIRKSEEYNRLEEEIETLKKELQR
tara:strand:- start:270 stop:590 length:321 start_codon:yes stop_codon:yes gene_type:complete